MLRFFFGRIPSRLTGYFSFYTKAAFELTPNWFRKWFSGKFGVWLLLQIWSNWKVFPVDRKWEPKQWKIISVFIFTSNDFRPWKIEEREREKKSKKIVDVGARRSHRSDRSNPPSSNLVTDHRDCLAIFGPCAKRETKRVERSSHRKPTRTDEARRTHTRRQTLTNPLAPMNLDEPTRTANPLASIHSRSHLKFL